MAVRDWVDELQERPRITEVPSLVWTYEKTSKARRLPDKSGRGRGRPVFGPLGRLNAELEACTKQRADRSAVVLGEIVQHHVRDQAQSLECESRVRGGETVFVDEVHECGCAATTDRGTSAYGSGLVDVDSKPGICYELSAAADVLRVLDGRSGDRNAVEQDMRGNERGVNEVLQEDLEPNIVRIYLKGLGVQSRIADDECKGEDSAD